MTGRRTGTRLRPPQPPRGATVLTKAFDTGADLRVVSDPRAAPPDVAAGDAPVGAPATDGCEVPRAGWPIPVRPVSPPTTPTAVPPTVTPTPASPSRTTGREPAEPPSAGEQRGPAVPADELEADIASIMAQPNRPAAQVAGGTQPARRPAPPPNRQAVFDQLAASMAGARSYDLGAVDLERRFDDFDRVSDAATARARTAAPLVSEPAPARTSEVLADLDAIRSTASGIPLDPGIGGRSIGVDALEPGDIILSTTTHALSRHIRAITDSEVSHAAVYIGDGRVVEALDGGVVLRSLDTALDDDSLAVAYRHRDMTPTKAALVVPFLEDHARRRTPYDRWGLVQVAPGQLARAFCNQFTGEARQRCLVQAPALRLGTNDEGKFFCSELVLEAFRHAGLSMSSLEPSWSTPGEIVHLHSNGLLDYVGHLKA